MESVRHVLISQLETLFDECRVQGEPAVHRNLAVIRREEVAAICQYAFSQLDGRVCQGTLFRIEDVHVVPGLPQRVGIVPNAGRDYIKQVYVFSRSVLLILEPASVVRIVYCVACGGG